MRRLVNFSVTFELLFFFSLTFIILVHTCSCFWIFVARFNQFNDQINWMDEKEVSEQSDSHIYILAVYFCITTITTVGYGDVSGFSSVERCFCIFLMLLGVISFSFATGFLSTMLNQYDSAEKEFREDLKLLEEMKQDYDLSQSTYDQIKQVLKLGLSQKNNEDFERL